MHAISAVAELLVIIIITAIEQKKEQQVGYVYPQESSTMVLLQVQVIAPFLTEDRLTSQLCLLHRPTSIPLCRTWHHYHYQHSLPLPNYQPAGKARECATSHTGQLVKPNVRQLAHSPLVCQSISMPEHIFCYPQSQLNRTLHIVNHRTNTIGCPIQSAIAPRSSLMHVITIITAIIIIIIIINHWRLFYSSELHILNNTLPSSNKSLSPANSEINITLTTK